MLDLLTARELTNAIALNMTNNEMRDFSSRPNVAMSYSNLMACCSYFINHLKRLPLPGELMLIDAFIDIDRAEPFLYAPFSVTATEKYISEALSDAMVKHRQLFPAYQSPCSLGRVLDIAASSVDYGSPRIFSSSETRLFSEEDDALASLKAAMTGYSCEKAQNGFALARALFPRKSRRYLSARSKYSVAVIYSDKDPSAELLCDFIRRSKLLKISAAVTYARGNEILNKIFRIHPSITIATDSLPGPSAPESDTAMTPEEAMYYKVTRAFFTDTEFGEYAVAAFVKRSKIKKIKKLVGKLGLRLCSAIRTTGAPLFKLSSSSGITTSIKSNAFEMISNPKVFDITVPPQAPIAATLDILRDKFFSSGEDTTVYTSSSELSDCASAFADPCRLFTDAVVSAAYDGINIKNSELSLSFRLLLPFDRSKEMGSSFASILGAYRSITEIGIPVEDFHLALKAGPPSLTVSLRAHAVEKRSSLVTDIPKEEFSSRFCDKEMIPDFNAVRALINGENL